MNYNNEKLRRYLLHKRIIELDVSLRDAAEQIGISSATLSRLEHYGPPDVLTLALVCKWLQKSPGDFFDAEFWQEGPVPQDLDQDPPAS